MHPGVLSPAGSHLQVIRDALRLLEVMTKRRQPHHIQCEPLSLGGNVREESRLGGGCRTSHIASAGGTAATAAGQMLTPDVSQLARSASISRSDSTRQATPVNPLRNKSCAMASWKFCSHEWLYLVAEVLHLSRHWCGCF